MKAAVVPAVASSWQIKDVAQPQPGSNQVLVKMHASGICYTDVHLTLGHFPGSFPRILGHDRWARSSPWRLTSRRERLATAWAPHGFNPLAGAANGACVDAECSVLT